jgi:hypothetical protein
MVSNIIFLRGSLFKIAYTLMRATCPENLIHIYMIMKNIILWNVTPYSLAKF